jgi:hypothetical protein
MLRSVGVAGFAAVLALAGCGQGSTRLSGRWHGVRADGVTPDAQAAATAFAARMQLEVDGDVMVVTTATGKQNCHFKTVRDEKDKLVITTDKDGPKDELVFTFVDAKTMRWLVTPDGKTIVFVKDEEPKK